MAFEVSPKDSFQCVADEQHTEKSQARLPPSIFRHQKLGGTFIDKDEGSAFGQGLGSLFPGNGDNALDSPSGNPHFLTGLFLGQAIHITESQRLHLIAEELYLSQF